MRMLLLLLICAMPPCRAGSIFECRDAQGHRSFQDHSCTGAKMQSEIVIASSAPLRKGQDLDARLIAAWEKSSRSRLPASLGGTTRSAVRASGSRSRAPGPPDACISRRETQARALRERGFEMGFDERRRLSDAVLNACGLH